MADSEMKRGVIMAFVKRHLTKSPDEIMALANSEGLTLLPVQISRARMKLRRKGLKLKKYKGGAKPGPRGVVRRRTSKHEPDPMEDAVRAPKQAELRRLIFEMGFDAARSVFEEFQAMHARMRN